MVGAAVETVAGTVAVPIAVHPVGHTVTIAVGVVPVQHFASAGVGRARPSIGAVARRWAVRFGRAVVATAMKEGARRRWTGFVVPAGVHRHRDRIAVGGTISDAGAAIHRDGRFTHIRAVTVAPLTGLWVHRAAAQARKDQPREKQLEGENGGFRVRQESMAHE